MSQDARDNVLERALTDPAFRALLARDPEKALAGYDLTPEERAAFQSGTVKAERLEDRTSKSDLSAAMSAKTSSPQLVPPSRTKRR